MLAHFGDFKDFVADKDYHVIGVTESWLHQDIPNNLISLPNYNLIRNDRKNKRGGGVALYLKNNLKYDVLFTESHEFLESIWVKICLKKQIYVIGTVYRPPNTDSSLFISTFEDTLINIFSTYDEILCMGDFNIDFLKLNNTLKNQLLSIVEPLNLSQIIDSPTRITDSSLSLIDLIFTNSQNITNKGVLDCPFSDHMLVFCQIRCPFFVNKANKISFRALKNINFEMFQRDLESIPFYTIYETHDIDEKIKFLNSRLLEIFNYHAPIKNITIRKRCFSPWITDNIKLMQKLRDKALKDFKNNKTPGKWAYYKQLRNFTTSAIRAEKKAYLNQKFQNSSTKEKWKELNKLRTSKIKEIPEKFKDVNKFNSFFVNATRSSTTLNDEIIQFYSNNIKDGLSHSLSFHTVELTDILQIIQNIKSKAFGSDHLNITLIHLCCPHILEYITHIINECIQRCYFPVCWKEAIVTPLPKVDDPDGFNQFRSISILPTLSKVLERVLEIQIRNFINSNSILPSKQSGFRPGYSCASAMADVTDDILRARDNNQLTALILLDYSKAFDFLHHKILCSLLHYIGFTERALHIISSYLTDRTQRVKIDSSISDSLSVTTGVPQGSILGPLLFSIYTFNFHTKLKFCNYHLYADDTQLYYSFSPIDYVMAEDNINTDLNALLKISTDHMLQLNPSKSSIILFGNKNVTDDIRKQMNIKIGNNQLQFTDKSKSLGLIIDSQLKFKDHVTYILKKTYYALKSIYEHRHCLEQNVKKILCDSLVLSHFNHCDQVYGPCLDNSDVRRVQKVQNCCVRFIFGLRRHNRISHKLQEISWLNMHDRRKLHATCFYYKILKFQTPPYLYNKITFRSDIHNLNLRRKSLTIPKHKNEFFKRSFSYNIALSINSLYLNLGHLALSCPAFKRKYMHVLLNHYHGTR